MGETHTASDLQDAKCAVRLPESITTGVDQWAQLRGAEARSAAIRILLEKAMRAALGGGDRGMRLSN